MRDQRASPVRPAARNHALDTGQRSRAMRGQRASVARAHARGDDEEAPPSAAAPWLMQRCFSGYYLAGDLRLAPTGITRRPALHARTDSPRKTDRSKSDQLAAAAVAAVEAGGGGGFWERNGAAHLGALGRTPQHPPQVLNTLSLVSVRESRIQYLCDPQWFRDTTSRGPTTIVAPESQFRTCPSDHDSIGYPRMSASGESSTTKHRLLHASGSHPIPPPNDPNYLELLACLERVPVLYLAAVLLCQNFEADVNEGQHSCSVRRKRRRLDVAAGCPAARELCATVACSWYCARAIDQI
ncbi:hypothetical protein F511_02118 [Dorcoceras hygrometricum]|nr:hypothetical protein F511_02118 [Dorcoceras hygrometricum]